MTWPTVAVPTANVDAGTDSPATARTDILDALTKLNQVMAHVSAFAATVLDDANAAAARVTLGAAASGANTDITSLAGPAIGAATATTQAAGTGNTTVATTAFFAASAVTLTGNQTVAGVKTFSSMPVVPTQSMVTVNTPNGAGSTNTCVQNFATVVTNQGSDITYAASGVNGATFTVNVSGVYACSLTVQHPNTNGHVGISLNSSQLTTNIETITAANRLTMGQAYAPSAQVACAWTGYIAAGGVIRVHTDTSTMNAGFSGFTISRA